MGAVAQDFTELLALPLEVRLVAYDPADVRGHVEGDERQGAVEDRGVEIGGRGGGRACVGIGNGIESVCEIHSGDGRGERVGGVEAATNSVDELLLSDALQVRGRGTRRDLGLVSQDRPREGLERGRE